MEPPKAPKLIPNQNFCFYGTFKRLNLSSYSAAHLTSSLYHSFHAVSSFCSTKVTLYVPGFIEEIVAEHTSIHKILVLAFNTIYFARRKVNIASF